MSNPDWYLDPPDEPQNPYCPECGSEMWRRDLMFDFVDFECRNPECENCAEAYRKEKYDE